MNSNQSVYNRFLSKSFSLVMCCDVDHSVSMLALSNTSKIYWFIACAVLASESPHGAFIAAASDNGGRMDFHRGATREMGGSDGSPNRISVGLCMSVNFGVC